MHYIVNNGVEGKPMHIPLTWLSSLQKLKQSDFIAYSRLILSTERLKWLEGGWADSLILKLYFQVALHTR